MKYYHPEKIEVKWQKKWKEEKLYQAVDPSTPKSRSGPKKYLLIEFPYPSGDGLHVGHCRSYSALDALARKKRMEGDNVLFPIGWDAFGLPTENYALKTGIHPIEATKKNVANFKRQCQRMGFSFDWSREINTTDSNYYKWTQWIFLQLFKRGLAYQAKMPINWCPSCKIGLANEEVVAGRCERCGTLTEKVERKQWMLKITSYAERLLKDLDKVDYLPKIKAQQINWIGRSEGVMVNFPIQPHKVSPCEAISVFTTRLDTIFGVTAIVVAPEHPLVAALLKSKKIKDYINQAKRKSEFERTEIVKEKTGVFTGLYCINPVNNESIPVWIGDYVVATYGGGAVMVVPAHDKRDFEFAKKYGLKIKPVVTGPVAGSSRPTSSPSTSLGVRALDGTPSARATRVFIDDGILINSGQFSGLKSPEAREKITAWLVKNHFGKKTVAYKLRDWVFSRQHYWGEPIPIIHCPKCGDVPVPEKDLPVKLPYVKNYQPTGTGDSPLAKIKDWVNVKCPWCGAPAKRETDTMPNWAGSNWYYLAYLVASKLGIKNGVSCHAELISASPAVKILNQVQDDPGIDIFTENKDIINYWMPVDLYNGGMEHTTLHLLYSRFIYKVLADIKAVPGVEPYARRHSHGMVLAQDGRKMSKSFGNVISPDDIVNKFGADTLRLYEMFMGPFEQAINWSPKGVEGCWRFLNKVWRLVTETLRSDSDSASFPTQASLRSDIRRTSGYARYQTVPGLGKTSPRANPPRVSENALRRLLHQTIKKVSNDLEKMKFNTAVAALMEFVNEMSKLKTQNSKVQVKSQNLNREAVETLVLLLAPFAPHLSEELWCEVLGRKFSVHQQPWPEYDPKLMEEEMVTIIVQVNGKMRGEIEVRSDPTSFGKTELRGAGKLGVRKEIEEKAKKEPRVAKYLKSKKIKRVIFVPGKIINFVLS